MVSLSCRKYEFGLLQKSFLNRGVGVGTSLPYLKIKGFNEFKPERP